MRGGLRLGDRQVDLTRGAHTVRSERQQPNEQVVRVWHAADGTPGMSGLIATTWLALLGRASAAGAAIWAECVHRRALHCTRAADEE